MLNAHTHVNRDSVQGLFFFFKKHPASQLPCAVARNEIPIISLSQYKLCFSCRVCLRVLLSENSSDELMLSNSHVNRR